MADDVRKYQGLSKDGGTQKKDISRSTFKRELEEQNKSAEKLKVLVENANKVKERIDKILEDNKESPGIQAFMKGNKGKRLQVMLNGHKDKIAEMKGNAEKDKDKKLMTIASKDIKFPSFYGHTGREEARTEFEKYVKDYIKFRDMLKEIVNKEKDDKIAKLGGRLETLKRENEENLRGIREKNENLMKQTMKTLENKKQEIEKWEKKLNEKQENLEKYIEKLKSELTEKNGEIAEVSKNLAEANNQSETALEAKNLEIAEWKNKFETEKQELEKLQDDFDEEINKKIAELEIKLQEENDKALKEFLESQKTTNDDGLLKNLNEARTMNGNLLEQLENVKIENEALLGKLGEKEKLIEEDGNTRFKILQEKLALEMNMAQKEAEIARLETERLTSMLEQSNIVQNLEAEVKTLENKLIASTIDQSEKMQEKEAEIDKLKKEKTHLERILAEKNTEIRIFNNEKKVQQKDVENLSVIQQYEKQIRELNEKIASSNIGAFETQIQQHEKTIQGLEKYRKELEAWNKDLSKSLKDTVDEDAKEITRLEKANQEARNRIKELEALHDQSLLKLQSSTN